MVEYISDLEELTEIIASGGPAIQIRVRAEDIEQWKKDGRFRFLKHQLQNLYNLKFSCTALENGDCAYYFIVPSRQLKNRITQLRFNLTADIRTPINKIQPSDDIEIPCSGYQERTFMSVSGTPKACPLF